MYTYCVWVACLEGTGPTQIKNKLINVAIIHVSMLACMHVGRPITISSDLCSRTFESSTDLSANQLQYTKLLVHKKKKLGHIFLLESFDDFTPRTVS